MENLKKIIQTNILEWMSQNNVSMRQLSADINCSESYVQKILSGDFTPKLEKLQDIADYFDKPLWMMFFDKNATPDKITQIEAFLYTFDEDALDATLHIVKRIQPISE